MPHKDPKRRRQYARERYAKVHPWHEKTDQERFWEKVDKHGPIPEHRPELGSCWLWTAGQQSAGYGKFRFLGTTTLAHRVAYFFANENLQKRPSAQRGKLGHKHKWK